jgi:integrase
MLTEVAIRNLAATDSRREIPDGKVTGLYLVVQPSGAKSWALRYRARGKPKKLTIGPYPLVAIAEARRRATAALGDVAAGKDPAAEKMSARAAARAEKDDMVDAVVNDFVKLYAARNTRDWRETERILKKDVVSRWRGRRLGEIERKHVAKLLDEMIDRGAPVGANRVFAQLRKMCSWAVERGIIQLNPCQGISRPTTETARERALSDYELALVWRCSDSLGSPFGPIVRSLILTAQRRDEVGGLVWDELDLDGALWTLPAVRSKNRREHTIPLAPLAVEILRAQRPFADSPFLFSARGRPPSGFAKAKERLDKSVTKQNGGKPIEHWTFHDLRRTAASGMAKIGVDLPVIEKVLNHVSGSFAGIVGIYQRHDFAAEKRAALGSWAARVAAIVGRQADGEAQS